MTEATDGSFLIMLFFLFGVSIIFIVMLAEFLKYWGKRQEQKKGANQDSKI